MKQLVWLIFLAVIGLITSVAQLDRQARRDAELANVVPEFARYFAQPAQIEWAAASEGPDAALVEARTLLKRRPIPAEHIRYYATAALQAGEAEEGFVAIQEAARRGWRDSQTQAAMAGIAVSNNDFAQAANRLAALYALAPHDPVVEELSELVLSNEEGSARFSEILAGQARWHPAFLRVGLQHLSPDIFLAVLSQADSQGAAFKCRALQLVGENQKRVRPDLAKAWDRLLERHCTPDPALDA